MDKLAQLLITVTSAAVKKTEIKNVVFTGGVASSKYISNIINNEFKSKSINIEFGDQRFSQDNAVGIALLGGKKIWQ